jgi:hypothetical protein
MFSNSINIKISNIKISAKTQCFVDGECRYSYLIQEAITLGENGCLNFCNMIEGCKWFTYHPGNKISNKASPLVTTFIFYLLQNVKILA